MHLLVGLVGLGALLVHVWRAGHAGEFSGLFHGPAALLVGLGPPLIALTSYRVSELLECARTLARALAFEAGPSRQALLEELAEFVSELRRGGPGAGMWAAAELSDPLLRQLAPLVAKRYGLEELERSAATASHCLSSSLRRQELVLQGLARSAPAMGLVGTVLGLVQLLRDLSDFSRLGPSMALALLCTLYGLVLANAVYQPLARRVQTYATVRLEEARRLTRGLGLVLEGRSMADVRALFESPQVEEPSAQTSMAGPEEGA